LRNFRRPRPDPFLGQMRDSVLQKGPKSRRKRRSDLWAVIAVTVAVAGIAFAWYHVFSNDPGLRTESKDSAPAAKAKPLPKTVEPPVEDDTERTTREGILRAAEDMLARGVRWDASYAVIPYPGGDVPADRGTGADLLVRTLRGVNVDLQALIHEDRTTRPDRYPLHRWNNAPPDTNIDHRRIANQWAFFNQYAQRLDAAINGTALANFLPGDVVFWGENQMEVPANLGIISAGCDQTGMPLVIAMRKENGKLSGEVPLNHRPLMAHFRVDISRLP